MIITNILAVSVPAFSKFLGLYFGIHKWLHSMVVETVRFKQVDNVEAVSTAWSCILNSEIVPLCVATSPVVWFKYQVILELIYLDSSAEISRFYS